MNTTLIILAVAIGLGLLFKLLNYSGGDVDSREKKNKERVSSQRLFSGILFRPSPLYDDEALKWCANFLLVDRKILTDILHDTSAYYTQFKLGKRSGGFRIIYAPKPALLDIQKTIYKRILLSANLHPACTGFRQNISIVHNAKVHLGNRQLLKIDIADFFGSIKRKKIINTFKKMGYPTNISLVLAELCIFRGKLPQGAATSPALSNIVAYEMDVELLSIAKKNNLVYTRYADDMTFSGEKIDFEPVLFEINRIVTKNNFSIQKKKTRFLTENKRKIVTGISVSSGEKLTIPKSKKREIRKDVHFILTRGLASHQNHIGSNDPVYLKRLIGYLHFWLMVEPDNRYVKKSLEALKRRL